jgi:DNA-binding XRE family transcriptional regulator
VPKRNMSPVERGKRLAEIRDANHLSQRQVGDRLGLTPQAVSLWERGKGIPEWWRVPDVDAAYEGDGKVAELFGATRPAGENADLRELMGEVLRRLQALEERVGLERRAVARRERPARQKPRPPR